jgi:RND family efflux transporter MFP subunit
VKILKLFPIGLAILLPTLSFSSGLAPIKVKASSPQVSLVQEVVESFGQCRALNGYDIISKASGTVTMVIPHDVKIVKKDQIILEIEGPKAHAEYNAAISAYKRSSDLFLKGLVSKEALEKARVEFENAVKSYNSMIIKAPINGIIGVIKYRPGDVIAQGDQITSILGQEPSNAKEIILQLPSNLIDKIDTSTKIQVLHHEKKIDGKVISVSDYISGATDTFKVRAEIDDQKGLIKHGSHNKVMLFLNPHNGLLIPQSAIMHDRNGHFVFKINSSNEVAKEYIKIGIRSGDKTEVIDGLRNDEKIVTEGMTKINHGDKVEIVD